VVVAGADRGVGGGEHAEVRRGQSDQLHHVEIARRAGLGLVGDLDLVAAQAEDVPHPEQSPPEQVGLEREPVAVAARGVDDRLDPLVERHGGRRPGRHARACARVVGELDEVERAAELAQLAADVGPVRTRKRPQAHRQDPPVGDGRGDCAAARYFTTRNAPRMNGWIRQKYV
jgi:hypothetical protein